MANIKEIARLAGVSVATVSRVLNGHPYVSGEKKEAVRLAMEAADYKRNINAVHLSRGKTDLIGVVVPSVRRPYFGMVLEGIAAEAMKAGCKLVLIQTDYDPARELDALMMLKHKQIDALIICSKKCGWDLIEEYASCGPVVVLEDGRGRSVSSIFIDHYKGFAQALAYLKSKGHTRIGYCLARQASPNSEQREAAYRDFYRELKIPLNPEYAFYACVHFEDGEAIMERIQRMEDPPTALLVTSDQVAAGVLTFCRERGIRVPEQLAVIGFDNQPIAKMMNITTFHIPMEEIGKKAFRHVMEGGLVHEEVPILFMERLTV